MDSLYANSSFIHSAVASGNSTAVQESKRKHSRTKWTKVLLIGLTVFLIFAIGGLVFLGIQYVNVSVQLSAQETNAKIMAKELEELRVNYTRVKEHLHNNEIMTRQLVANFTRVKEQLSFCQDEPVNHDRDWTDFHGKFYYFSSNKLNWSSSRDFCVSKGADLVTITSQEEQRFLHSKIATWYWIGLSDLETEGRWVWVNGQTLQEIGVQFWYQRQSQKSEPDNWKNDDPSGEHCVTIKAVNLDNWFDVSCNYKLMFICEKSN